MSSNLTMIDLSFPLPSLHILKILEIQGIISATIHALKMCHVAQFLGLNINTMMADINDRTISTFLVVIIYVI